MKSQTLALAFLTTIGLSSIASTATAQAPSVSDQSLALHEADIGKLEQSMAQLEKFSIYSGACSSVVKDLIQWKLAAANHRVDYKLSGNKIKTPAAEEANYGFSFFAEGDFSYEGGNLVSTSPVLFSDRSANGQPFLATARDIIRLTLQPRGAGFINFVTWGNARSDFDGVICTQDSFGAQLVTRVREGNGTSVMVLSLHKGQ
jgi:hypothetical protein